MLARAVKSPVLFLVFNRPDNTRQVFDAIRLARPSKLYIAADGPRVSRLAEAQLCSEVRNIAVSVDWPCEVKTLFRETNLGCKVGVSSGITWFFSHEDEGIILEDDVLPVPTFFRFCDEMLERYRKDTRVSMISGCNLISSHFTPKESYFFSRYNHIWGWATWRRAWQHYDVTMAQWPAWRDAYGLEKLSGDEPLFKRHWRSVFDAAYECKIDTWDYQWTFAIWRMGGLTVLPAVNQTLNLGFGADATHTTHDVPAYVSASRPGVLEWPLRDPSAVKRDARADRLINSKVFGITMTNLIKGYLRRFRSLASARFSEVVTAGHTVALRSGEVRVNNIQEKAKGRIKTKHRKQDTPSSK